MSRFRLRRSLLWTFTGAFLLVLLVGIILQGTLVALVLGPAARHWRTTTRNAIARSVADRIEDAVAAGQTDLQPIVRDAALQQGGLVVVYRPIEGRPVGSGADGAPLGALEERPFGRPGRRGGPQGPLRGPWRRTAGAAEVAVGGEKIGDVFVLPPRPDPGFRLEGVRRPWLLFLPLAALLAGAAGFLLFRLFARRLAHLEQNVRRVAEGDLGAEVTDPGSDEIGRLGASFNLMARRLRESRDALIAVDRQRRRFLADVTHDLATPLTTIRGYAETLRDPKVPKDPEEIDRYLRFIQEEADRMDGLVADLLDLARVESGQRPLERETVDLRGLVAGEAARLRPRFREAGIALEGPESEGPPVEATVDRRRVEQLLVNVLQNAFQHLPGGGIVRVSVGRSPEDGGEILVEDDGPGFREEDLPHVFERFYRGDPARPSGGTGLGLAIV
ncbi:MAG: HAMP domain-containing protein, partial [Candidatus Eisenbacteria bacterium]|nr:HAMP domain-containing protein [Candidatus Latescibacterota bacterium]MBD3303189.1 HAMP domain-containing protein [Candidatus Eisenbacteria bacterium]